MIFRSPFHPVQGKSQEVGMKRSSEFSKCLQNIFSSGCWERYEKDIETLSRFLLVNAACLLGSVFFCSFGIWDILHGVEPLGAVSLATGVLIGLDFIYLRVTRRLLLASYFNVFIVSFAFLYLLITGGSLNTGPLWLYSFPVAALFLLGLKGGTVATLFFLIASSVILYYPDFPLVMTTYPVEFKARFISSMVGVAVLSYVIEYIRFLTQKRLLLKNHQLEESMIEVNHAKAALTYETERLSVTLRSIGDGVITTDTEGRILLINPVAELLTGWVEQDAVGRSLVSVLHLWDADTLQMEKDPVRGVLQTKGVVVFSDRTVLQDRHGNRKAVLVSGAPIRRGENEIIGVVIVLHDITGQRKMEEELLKAKKLESIGILAGGIAHDFNNFLTGILSNSQLAKVLLKDPENLSQCLDGIEEAARRATSLTHQLLTFSKGGVPVKKRMEISGLIRKTVDFALSGSKVRSRFFIQKDLRQAEVDEGQISQVISNLVINAQQAMPEGGEVEITAENVTITEGQVPGLSPGTYVRLSVQDHGEGIAEEHLSRIFDPYFTTKEQGNGLGLATAYSIVNKHHGKIMVESNTDSGTLFSIYLPALEDGGNLPSKTGEREVDLLKGKGKILVMDDEEFVLRVVRKMLSVAGYEVESAGNGREAIKKYKEAMRNREPFQVVIMDLTIPGGMGGTETLQELLKMDPEVKAVVSSGYSNDPVMAYYQRYGFRGCITKPIHMGELLKTISEVISQ